MKIEYADVVELVDSVDLGSSVIDVQVRVLSSAPISRNGLVLFLLITFYGETCLGKTDNFAVKLSFHLQPIML